MPSSALWQAHPEVVINRRNRGALPNRGHGTDQNALYLRFTERCKESAERAAWRLRRHRSSGDLEKKTACCSNSSSSRPRAPRNRRRMRRTRARLVRLAVARFINSTLAQRPPRHNPDSCQKNLVRARLADMVPPWHQRRLGAWRLRHWLISRQRARTRVSFSPIGRAISQCGLLPCIAVS